MDDSQFTVRAEVLLGGEQKSYVLLLVAARFIDVVILLSHQVASSDCSDCGYSVKLCAGLY